MSSFLLLTSCCVAAAACGTDEASSVSQMQQLTHWAQQLSTSDQQSIPIMISGHFRFEDGVAGIDGYSEALRQGLADAWKVGGVGKEPSQTRCFTPTYYGLSCETLQVQQVKGTSKESLLVQWDAPQQYM